MEIPEAWSLAIALDAVARKRGWESMARTVSRDEVVLIYRKNPLIALIDSLPEEDQ